MQKELNEIKKVLYKTNAEASVLIDDFKEFYHRHTSANDSCYLQEEVINAMRINFIKEFKELTKDFTHLNYLTYVSNLGFIEFSIPLEECYYDGKPIFNITMPAKELIRWIKI